MKYRPSPALVSVLLLAAVATASQDAAPATAPSSDAPTTKPAKLDYQQLMDPFVAMVDRKDPLGRIAGQMGSAAQYLAQLNTRKPTQPLQEDIIAEIDEFIDILEKQKKTLKAGGGADPDAPLPDTAIAGGPGGQRELRDPSASSRLWGQLPPKQREQILQSQNQGFPSGYEAILSSYYKRLAQENVEGASEPAPASTPLTQPATR